ncbi:MAG: radical SAM protein [Candidatus Methanomethyliaceae archaeon]|nr:radical SAM protein [Candidatus Methanomethyliaceae archaeon]MDW7971417.1 radical SAM protein [Nitrososphaerota archaeon]
MLFAEKHSCINCNVCREIISCSGVECFGCGACYLACPNEAISMKKLDRKSEIKIFVNNEAFHVPDKITVRKALEILGYKIGKFPGEGDIFVPCETGGCYSCAVEINGVIKPSCITGVYEGMKINTNVKRLIRAIHGWMGHPVGGVGTPWWLKGRKYIEVAAFACGCNLRCPQCQNWTTTYNNKIKPMSPNEAAIIMTKTRKLYGVNRMAISGGECTLNKEWLIEYIKSLKKLNPDGRIHVDTNATIITKDYMDELVEAGMTDIGIDLKGFHLETFMKIVGINDKELARKYHETSWNAFKNAMNYDIFVGIGIPYNKDLITMDEIVEIGEEIYKVNNEVQVCVLDYRPEFRRMNLSRPSFDEMLKIWKLLKSIGLKTVICQTIYGHIGP